MAFRSKPIVGRFWHLACLSRPQEYGVTGDGDVADGVVKTNTGPDGQIVNGISDRGACGGSRVRGAAYPGYQTERYLKRRAVIT